MSDLEDKAQLIIQAGRRAYERGWVPATSGNFSVRLSDDEIMVTVSGKHKGMLTEDDLMRVNLDGVPLDNKKPSAETLLHTSLYSRYPHVQSVLHTHSVNATLLSRFCKNIVELEDFELLKAFNAIDTHASRIEVPIFANDQDIDRLSKKVDDYLDGNSPVFGYLIEGHGIYTWAESISETFRYLEAFEFLFECKLQEIRLAGR